MAAPPRAASFTHLISEGFGARAHHNTEVCVAAGKEIASRATVFQPDAMLGVGRSGGIEKTSFISLTSEERRARLHMA